MAHLYICLMLSGWIAYESRSIDLERRVMETAISESCPLAVLKALCYACLYFDAYRKTVYS